jgi:alpha-maltose-1-phosphate synthase
MKILIAHPGTQHSMELAVACQRFGTLHLYVTRLYFRPKSLPFSLIALLPAFCQRRVLSFLERRRHNELAEDRVRTLHTLVELCVLLAYRLKLPRKTADDFLLASQRWFAHSASQMVADADVVIGYMTAALECFTAAKRLRKYCILDLAQSHESTYRRLLSEENLLHPDLASTASFCLQSDWVLERYRNELDLADQVWVGSQFAKSTLTNNGVRADKIRVIPYGVDTTRFSPPQMQRPRRTFRALFVGSIGILKGIIYLLEAWRACNFDKAELILCGRWSGPQAGFDRYRHLFRHVPYTSHEDLPELYRTADVFILPSLAEGFARVLLEAMACGVTAIASTNTGAVDLIEEATDGFIVPIRDAAAIADRLRRLYLDRDLCAEMGRKAALKAKDFTWHSYAARVDRELRGIPHD